MKKNIVLILLTICIYSWDIYSQDVSPSPEAMSELDEGALYTGSNPVSIPITTVTGRRLSVPVTLHHSGGAIKTTEVASSVGLGWSMSCGGLITRVVKGLPDDSPQGFLNRVEELPLPEASWFSDHVPMLGAPAHPLAKYDKREYDGEVDEFHFNFPGGSGKFIIGRDKQIRKYGLDDLEIKVFFDVDEIDYFTITGTDGTVYTFQETVTSTVDLWGESSYSLDLNNLKTSTDFTSGAAYNDNVIEFEYYSSWYLSEIKSADETETITFEYTQNSYGYTMLIGDESEEFYLNTPSGKVVGNFFFRNKPLYTYIDVNEKLINKITSPLMEVIFTYDDERWDLGSSATGPLKKIEVKSINDGVSTLKTDYTLGYIYSPGVTEQQAAIIGIRDGKYRLMLSQVKEKYSSPYKIDYYWGPGDKVYDRGKPRAQDHWGYYNGQDNNECLVNEYFDYDEQVNNNYTTLSPNRGPSFEYAKSQAIKKITFPYGGSKTFKYEQHDYYKAGCGPDGNCPSGGIRIKEVVYNDNNGNRTHKYYYYKKPNPSGDGSLSGTSSGIQLSEPEYDRVYQYGIDVGNGNGDMWKYSSNSRVPLATSKGSHIEYEYVTVTDGVNGKTEYYYNTTEDFPDISERYKYIEWQTVQTNSTNNKDYGSQVTNNDWRRGTLKEKKVYKQGNVKKTHTYYYYQYTLPSISDVICYKDNGKVMDSEGTTYFKYYRPRVGYKRLLDSIVTREYNDASTVKYLKKNTTYYYESQDHYFPTRVITDDGEGGKQLVKTKYAVDYNNSAGGCIFYFKNKNMKSVAIEKQTWAMSVGSSVYRLVSGTVKTYTEGPDNQSYVPYKEYALETAAPIPEGTIAGEYAQYIPGTGFTQLVPSTTYYKERLTYTKYDSYNMVVEQQPKYGVYSSVIYGYENSLPVANVRNARHSDVTVEDFESTLSYGSQVTLTTSDPRTGAQCGYISASSSALSCPVSPRVSGQSGPGGRTFIFKAYMKSTTTDVKLGLAYIDGTGFVDISGLKTVGETNKWVWVEGKLTVPETTSNPDPNNGVDSIQVYIYKPAGTSADVYVDAVRLYPEGAFMTTTTYKPLFGVTSETDDNGNTQYKKYNNQGRVEQVLDNDRNILEEYDYYIYGY